MTPPAALTCELNSALLNRLPATASSPPTVSQAVTQPGLHGLPSATLCTKIHGSQTLTTQYPSYKSMLIDPSGSPVKARTVEAALRAVGQMYAALGFPNLRLQDSGRLDFRLQCQLQYYGKADPPPYRVKPIPLQIIQATIQQCYRSPLPHSQTIGDMLLLGFFFLLRLGEYAGTANEDAAPFTLANIHIIHNNTRLHPLTCPEHQLIAASLVALEFTTQKSGVRGELVGLGRSGHDLLCPVLAIINRIRHFRLHQAPLNTPLYTYRDGAKWSYYHNNPHTMPAAISTSLAISGHHARGYLRTLPPLQWGYGPPVCRG